MYLYADDTALCFEIDRHNPHLGQKSAQRDLKRIEQWSKRWLVTFAPHKTKSMLIAPKGAKRLNFSVAFMGHDLQDVITAKHLGLIINNFATWEDHICKMLRRAKQRLYILKRTARFLSREVILKLVNAFIRPILEMVHLLGKFAQKLFLQNLIPFMHQACVWHADCPFYSAKCRLYEETGVSDLGTRREFQKLKCFHLLAHKLCPPHLLLIRSERAATLLDRVNFNFWSPHNLKQRTDKLIVETAIKSWNKLPTEIKNTSDHKKFISRLRSSSAFQQPRKKHFHSMGSKFINTVLCKLRHNCSQLNNDRHHGSNNPLKHCRCSPCPETAEHFLLCCPLYNKEKQIIMTKIALKGIRVEHLLSGVDIKYYNTIIIDAFGGFIQATKRITY